MPLFNYMCLKCNKVIERFQHKPKKIEIKCKECGNEEFKRVLGKILPKITHDAKGTYKNRIAPEIDRICKNMANGKDKDFIDIAGD